MASPHSDWILDAITPASLRKHLPAVYEFIMAPIYWLYRLVGPANAEWLAHGTGLAEYAAEVSIGAGHVAAAGALLVPLVGAAVVLTKGTGARGARAAA